MFLSMKLLSFFSVIFSVVGGLLSSSVLSMWFFLELSTVSFLLGLMFMKFTSTSKETMKLFLIQALTGMSILLLLLFSNLYPSYPMSFFIWLVVLLKMSAVPFHMWFLNLSNKMPWESVLLFLTVMKFIPLMILSNSYSFYIIFFSNLSLVVSSVSSIYYSGLKNLMVLSSLYFLGMLFFLLNLSTMWLDMMLIYVFLFLPVFLVFSNMNNSIFNYSWINSLSTFSVFLLMVNLSGMPPFPGFFMKYMWLVNSSIDFSSFLVFFITSGIMAYMYLSFTLKNLLEFSGHLYVGPNFTKMGFLVVVLFIVPTYLAVLQ